MNFYVCIINDIVEHIERNIGGELQLADISALAGISGFHFNRLFKTIAGVTLKQYVLGRKLTSAAGQLLTTNKSILDIALDFGFAYPEVFSRAFKKQFGISPSDCRQHRVPLQGINKAAIVERDIINYRGTLALKGNCVLLEDIYLCGISVKADTNAETFRYNLKTQTESFLHDTMGAVGFKQERFFTIVSCDGTESGLYNVFCGREPEPQAATQAYSEYSIPAGWYVDFHYHGDMFDIREVFIDDLYKWIMVKEAELNPNGIGMLNIYSVDYPQNDLVHIYVPIKKPV